MASPHHRSARSPSHRRIRQSSTRAPGSGVYKSTDGGATWRRPGGGLPLHGLGRIGIAVAPSRPDRVYALVDADKGGLYRSDDAGTYWRRINDNPMLWYRGWYFGTLA